MNHFFIDFENVHSEELKHVSGAKEGDEITLFHSNSCKSVTLEALDVITKLGCRFKCQKVSSGTKNALDFQLTSQLGYTIATSAANDEYFIVSKDKGYDCLASYWKQKNRKVQRLEPKLKVASDRNTSENISRAKTSAATKVVAKQTRPRKGAEKKTSNPNSNQSATLKEAKAVLNKDECPEEILKIINKYKTKQAIANQISKILKNTQLTGEIYKKLKPLLKEKGKK